MEGMGGMGVRFFCVPIKGRIREARRIAGDGADVGARAWIQHAPWNTTSADPRLTIESGFRGCEIRQSMRLCTSRLCGTGELDGGMSAQHSIPSFSVVDSNTRNAASSPFQVTLNGHDVKMQSDLSPEVSVSTWPCRRVGTWILGRTGFETWRQAPPQVQTRHARNFWTNDLACTVDRRRHVPAACSMQDASRASPGHDWFAAFCIISSVRHPERVMSTCVD